MKRPLSPLPSNTPWYLSRSFFGFFFGSVLGIIILTILLQVGLVIYAGSKLKDADFSQGVKPVVESFWCGKPGCLSQGVEGK